MNPSASYACNDELFGRFYALQNSLAGYLAGHPALIRAWLDAQPRRVGEPAESGGASNAWRTARLSVARRRELCGLLDRAEIQGAARLRSLACPGGAVSAAPPVFIPLDAGVRRAVSRSLPRRRRLDASYDAANFPPVLCAAENLDARKQLGDWLLRSVPVRIYLEIADLARPNLQAIDSPAAACHRELVLLRESLFLSNYGLARVATLNRNHPDHGDRLSAASCGLLDAVDRYVPGARSARFAYFASYWIRYHLSRHAQKNGCLVSFPINQHRISRRIDRCVADRKSSGRPAPSETEICAELQVGLDACYWHQRRPRVLSLHSPAGPDPDSPTMEHLLFDPAPEPSALLEEREMASHLRSLLRAKAAPAARVMLAYSRRVGALPEAAEDYLAHLHRLACDRICRQADRLRVRSACSRDHPT